MASQGPRYPTVAVNELVAPEDDDAWVSPTNVGADDTSEATITAATFDSPDISQRLNTSGYGFTIPSGATIDGIVVEIMRRNSAGAASDNRVQLRDAAGALVGDNKADLPLDWPTTEALKTYGTSTDTWAASPTPAMVNDADFGLTLSAQADAANTDIQVDFIRITVYYTAANGHSEVSWAELETPSPPAADGRSEVSWAELETPVLNGRADVSWAEFEVPFALGRIDVSWAELEVPFAQGRTELSWAELEVPTSNGRVEVSWAEFEVPAAVSTYLHALTLRGVGD